MEWYEDDVRALENLRSSRPAVADPVVFYGSSTIRLWTTIARDLGDSRVVNLAFGGSTLEACGCFFERLVPPESPVSLVTYAGDNDLGDGRNPEQVLTYFRDLASKVQRRLPGIPFGFISIKPSPARFGIIGRISRTNEYIRREIERYPNAWYIDIFDAMLNRAGEPRAELFLEDGLHLSPAGYELWTRLLKPYRKQIFK
jgi:lysophospholipase L1-like esterase